MRYKMVPVVHVDVLEKEIAERYHESVNVYMLLSHLLVDFDSRYKTLYLADTFDDEKYILRYGVERVRHLNLVYCLLREFFSPENEIVLVDTSW